MGGGEAGSEAPQVCRGKEEKGEEETVLKGRIYGDSGGQPLLRHLKRDRENKSSCQGLKMSPSLGQ